MQKTRALNLYFWPCYDNFKFENSNFSIFSENWIIGQKLWKLDPFSRFLKYFWKYMRCIFILTLSSMGSASLLFHGGGVQSARSLIGLSRDLIRPFPGHHTPLYSVGVSYGASKKKYSKNLEKWSSFPLQDNSVA